VERFAGLGFTVEANAEGGATVTLDADDAVFTAALPVGETVRLADQEALWQILEDGQVRFEFLAEDVDADVIAEGGGPRETVITGRGTASVLEWAPVLPAGMPTPSSMSRTFQLHPMAAWHALFLEAQAAGFLTWVNLSFDEVEDSTGTAWGPAQSLTVNAGDTLLDLLKRWAEANELRWRMLPGFTLEVRQGDGSHLEDSVVFTQFRSQGGHRRKVTRRELANVVYADSGDNGVAIAQDGTSAAKWRKRAAWVTAGDASDASARSMVANVSLGLAKDQRISRTIALIPDREGRHPFVDFNVHDWVGVEVPDDETESGARKVAGLAVDIDADGVVQYEATLSSRFEVRAVKTQRLLDKLGGSERSGSGGAASSPIPVSKIVSATNLADLSDVDLTAPAPGSLLQYSGGRWVDVVANLDLLADVATAGASAPTAGQVLTYDAAAGLWKPATPAAGGGGSAWEKVIDVPGTTWTPADWIVAAGTWGSDGAAITQTSTAANLRARLSKKVLTGFCIVDAEILVVSSTTSDTQAGILIGTAGTGGTVGTSGTLFRLHMNLATADKVEIEQDQTAARFSSAMNWGGLNVWKKVRAVQMGGVASVYLDGVLLGSAGNNANASNDASWVGLKASSASVKFRNIKVWNPVMPALP
jgi:hypothetical protein